MKKLRLFIPLGIAVCLVIFLFAALKPVKVTAVTPNPPDGWFFKSGGWLDYAPNGVPDFDQQHPSWNLPGPAGLQWTHCGPVAVANSLWWFDSKFEPDPAPPLIPNDNYYLVTSYTPGDDHFPINVGGMGPPGLVDDLACYFKTNKVQPYLGTEVHQMAIGLQEYLYNDPQHPCYQAGRSKDGSYYDDYHVQLVKMPAWEWVVDEVQRSEDVILLLGFWQPSMSGPGPLVRVGGHYVTVNGINEIGQLISFSDPYFDNAELGMPGLVFTGTIHPHPVPHPGPGGAMIHNDAGNISRDYFSMIPPFTPYSLWGLANYPVIAANNNFGGQNCPAELVPFCYEFYLTPGLPVFVEVEYAIAMSPFHWKAGGEWVDVPSDDTWETEWWWYEDDGDSCLPDFSFFAEGDVVYYTDGPLALENSFWWFDSKAETLVTGNDAEEPPAISDNYNMVVADDPAWDDHSPKNTIPFMDTLADYITTTNHGTVPEDMYSGILNYMFVQGVDQDFYVDDMEKPSFHWLANEVEKSEDVLILLGFYELMPDGVNYERKGGHWVNAAGINADGGLIGLSDPWIDHANMESASTNLYLGRVFPPDQLGESFTEAEKLEPQSISHDIYKVGPSSLPNKPLELDGYPVESFFDIYAEIVGLNGGGSPWMGGPLSTVLEYAIGVSPYSDLVITKTVPVTLVNVGDTISYTIEYANTGFAAVHDVVITDTVPTLLSNVYYEASPSIATSGTLTYTWTVPLLSYGQGGKIIVYGDAKVRVPPYNLVCIDGDTSIGTVTPDRDETNNCDDAGSKFVYLLYLPSVLK